MSAEAKAAVAKYMPKKLISVEDVKIGDRVRVTCGTHSQKERWAAFPERANNCNTDITGNVVEVDCEMVAVKTDAGRYEVAEDPGSDGWFAIDLLEAHQPSSFNVSLERRRYRRHKNPVKRAYEKLEQAEEELRDSIRRCDERRQQLKEAIESRDAEEEADDDGDDKKQ